MALLSGIPGCWIMEPYDRYTLRVWTLGAGKWSVVMTMPQHTMAENGHDSELTAVQSAVRHFVGSSKVVALPADQQGRVCLSHPLVDPAWGANWTEALQVLLERLEQLYAVA